VRERAQGAAGRDCDHAQPAAETDAEGRLRLLVVVAAPERSRSISTLLRILRPSPSLPPWARQPRRATRARREGGKERAGEQWLTTRAAFLLDSTATCSVSLL